MKARGLISFPAPLLIGPDSLGQHLTGTVDGTAIELELPPRDALYDLGARGDVTHRRAITNNLGLPDEVVSRLSEGWGTVWTNYYKVNAALLSADDIGKVMDPAERPVGFGAASPPPRGFVQQFYDWFEIVRYWLAAWTDVNEFWVGSGFRCVVALGRGDQFGIADRSFQNAGVHYVKATLPTPIQLQSACDYASAREHIPVEYRLILDAENAISAGDFRRAVIDSTTAIEVALAGALAERLRRCRVNQSLIDEIVKQANGVSGLASLYISEGNSIAVSKARLRSEVANLRNLAAHAGKHPTEDQAKTAVGHAKSIVRTVEPLPLM